MKKAAIALMVLVLFAFPILASDISFSGGQTKVTLTEGDRRVNLSGGASVSTPDMDIKADSIELYGEDYCYATCTGNVVAEKVEDGILIMCPSILLDRNAQKVTSDSWIEIQDTNNQAALCGAWFEYDMEAGVMTLKMMARIVKVTDEGVMVCRADCIEFDSTSNTVTMKGNATVSYKNDTYSAAMIVVDLDTNDLSMYGDISGVVNG